MDYLKEYFLIFKHMGMSSIFSVEFTLSYPVVTEYTLRFQYSKIF